MVGVNINLGGNRLSGGMPLYITHCRRIKRFQKRARLVGVIHWHTTPSSRGFNTVLMLQADTTAAVTCRNLSGSLIERERLAYLCIPRKLVPCS